MATKWQRSGGGVSDGAHASRRMPSESRAGIFGAMSLQAATHDTESDVDELQVGKIRQPERAPARHQGGTPAWLREGGHRRRHGRRRQTSEDCHPQRPIGVTWFFAWLSVTPSGLIGCTPCRCRQPLYSSLLPPSWPDTPVGSGVLSLAGLENERRDEDKPNGATLESRRHSPRLLEPEVLERRRVRKAWNQAHARLRDAWTDPGERAQLVQRRVHDAFVQDALDLMQQRLTLRPIDFPGLALEQVLDLGVHAVGENPGARHVGLEARGRVPGSPADADNDASELLLTPSGEERRALHRPDSAANADGLQITRHRFAHRDVGGIRIEVAGVEPARVAGRGQELLGPCGIVWRRVERERELEDPGNDRARRTREAERLCLIQGLAIDRQAGREADALVVPRGFRIPLVGEVHPEDAKGPRRPDSKIGRASDVLG